MRSALAIGIGGLIFLAMIASFSDVLGLDALVPGFEVGKTAVVGIVFLLMAAGGLFHRINKVRKRRSDD